VDIKRIFSQGFKELKRRSQLMKKRRAIKQKKRGYSEQLAVLGQKAWEANVHQNDDGSLEKLIASTQERLKELNSEIEERKKQTADAEEKRKNTVARYESRRKEIETKIRALDVQLDEERSRLKEAQKDSDRSSSRLSQIAKEEESLKRKQTAPETTDIEKGEIPSQLANLVAEKDQLHQKLKVNGGKIAESNDKIKPLETEAAGFQKDVDELKTQHKAALNDVDKAIAELKDQIDERDKTVKEVDKEQKSNFEQLGGQVAADPAHVPGLTGELSVVHVTEKELSMMAAEIESLRGMETDESRSAFWRMIALSAAALLVLIGLIVVLGWLFGSKEKDPLEKTPPTEKPGLADLVTDLTKPRAADPGKDIVLADKGMLTSVLPQVSGWQAATPSYNAQQLGQLQGSTLAVDYKGPDSRRVSLPVTDTGQATALLRPYLMVFNLNTIFDDADRYEKVETYGGHKVIEKFDKRNKRGRMTLVVKDRYLVQLKSQGDDCIAILKTFLNECDFSKLQ